MKKQLLFILIALFGTAQGAWAQVEVNETNFPDPIFRAWVQENCGNLSSVTNLWLNDMGIADLTGIEYFTALKSLFCANNQLSELDLSKNTQLETLDCYGNYLVSLDFSNNKKLKALWCKDNYISESEMGKLVKSLPTVDGEGEFVPYTTAKEENNVINTWQVAEATEKHWKVKDFSPSGAVAYAGAEPTGIAISETNFPDANFRAYVKASCQTDGDNWLYNDEIDFVWQIEVQDKGITKLNGIEFFPSLQYMYCQNNQLTSIDVSKNSNLRTLYCDNNQLGSIDVSKNTLLSYLSCNYIGLTTLDVSANPNLEGLDCVGNQLTSLDLSKNPVLRTLWCHSNQINESEMGKLVKSMPTVQGDPGDFCVINYTDEQNVINTSQVAEAVGKNWKVKKRASNGSTSDYEGVAPSGIHDISRDVPVGSRYYSIDGKRIDGKPAQKGLFIHHGKKIVVK